MMEVMMKKHFGLMAVVAVILFVCVFLGVRSYVHSASEGAAKIDESFYQQMEKTYLNQVKAEILNCGYANSGVTMTRLSLSENERNYRLEIYNRLLDGKTDRQNQVREAIESISFDDSSCNFEVVFLSMAE